MFVTLIALVIVYLLNLKYFKNNFSKSVINSINNNFICFLFKVSANDYRFKNDKKKNDSN